MRRPIVKDEIVRFMRETQEPVTGFLKEIESFSREENIPIIPRETVAYFRILLQLLKPNRILEVGTAVGFSALLMADTVLDAKITTIDRNPEMINIAKENFKKYDQRQQIELLEGDAAGLLASLEGMYDFVFMDSSKSQYIVFLPSILEHLEVGGLIVIDDIFQGGDITKPAEEINRKTKSIYRGLRRLLKLTLNHPNLTSSLLPLGDGLLLLRKNKSEVVL